jgi:amino acid transporter
MSDQQHRSRTGRRGESRRELRHGPGIGTVGPAGRTGTPPAGLRHNAISFVSNVVIGVASTAPGYSLAATLGLIVAVAGIGLQTPAIMIVAFVPMLCIAAAYYWLNRTDPDCGTTFAWVTKAMGPHLGWLGGWGIIAADILVMPSLANVAGNYTFLLVGWHSAAANQWAVLAMGVAWIAVMTLICYVGVELSARTQRILLTIEVTTLLVFAVVALVKVYARHPAGSITPALSWFNPFAISSASALSGGVLLAIFVYWGWDSGVAVNEETEDSTRAPGRAAIVSTLLLVAIYVFVTTAAQAFAGTKTLAAHPDDIFAPIGTAVLGGTLDKLLILAVLTSASASTQTTILPTARTALSMGREGALPRAFARIHPRYRSPDVSTLAMGGVSALLLVVLTVFNVNLIFDAFTALGLMIAFYYGITGFACAIYYRRQLRSSVRNALFIGVLPVAGGIMLTWVLVQSLVEIVKPHSGFAGPILGVGAPFAIALATMLLGAVLLVACRRTDPAFFRRGRTVARPSQPST